MTDIKNVLVLTAIPDPQKHILEDALPEAVFTYSTPAEATDEMLYAADAVIGKPDPAKVRNCKHLKLVQLPSSGTNGYVESPDILPAGTVLCSATGSYGLTISEYLIGALLNIYRKFYLYRDNQKKHLWHREGEVRSIYGSTILIVGMGDIGSEFARRVKAMGATTIGVRRHQTEKPEYLDELHLSADLDELLPRADVVVIALPGTKDTRNMFDETRLKKMKDDAVLINVGRGFIVDDDALARLMNEGKFLGACMDVTEPEPLPADHPLWDVPNALITPHASGTFSLPETFDRMLHIAAHNLKAIRNGTEPRNVVDFETGYRKI